MNRLVIFLVILSLPISFFAITVLFSFLVAVITLQYPILDKYRCTDSLAHFFNLFCYCYGLITFFLFLICVGVLSLIIGGIVLLLMKICKRYKNNESLDEQSTNTHQNIIYSSL